MKPRKRPEGKKVGIDLEKIEPSNNHNGRIREIVENLEFLRLELVRAERNGKYSKAKKLRRLINQEHEAELYIRHSWCGGCNNVLHNCICQ